jgi:5-methylcytosine-specific restriction endonuclease McrA
MADETDDLFGDDKFAQAAAEGRVLVGMTAEQIKDARRVKQARFRANNLERVREINRESMQRAAAAKAVAEGREPGRRGRPPLYTEEEKRAKRKAKSEKWNADHLDETRTAARERGQAKRDGTFVSRAFPRLTPEEKRLTEVAWAATRRTRLRANGGKFTRLDIAVLMVAQAGRCLFCSEPLGEEPVHVDHWMPVAKGGSSDPDNLALLHQSCNGRKGARLPSEFGLPDSPLPLREMLSAAPPDEDCLTQEE